MTTKLTAALLVLVLATSVAAQTVESRVDLSAFGWGPLDTPVSIETDGDFATREWLIRSVRTNQYRVVAERDGLCAGPWFTPTPPPVFIPASVTVQRVGLVHKIVVRRGGSAVTEMFSLDTPACAN